MIESGYFLTVLDYENGMTFVYKFTEDMYNHYDKEDSWEDLIDSLGFKINSIYWICNKALNIMDINQPTDITNLEVKNA